MSWWFRFVTLGYTKGDLLYEGWARPVACKTAVISSQSQLLAVVRWRTDHGGIDSLSQTYVPAILGVYRDYTYIWLYQRGFLGITYIKCTSEQWRAGGGGEVCDDGKHWEGVFTLIAIHFVYGGLFTEDENLSVMSRLFLFCLELSETSAIVADFVRCVQCSACSCVSRTWFHDCRWICVEIVLYRVELLALSRKSFRVQLVTSTFTKKHDGT